MVFTLCSKQPACFVRLSCHFSRSLLFYGINDFDFWAYNHNMIQRHSRDYEYTWYKSFCRTCNVHDERTSRNQFYMLLLMFVVSGRWLLSPNPNSKLMIGFLDTHRQNDVCEWNGNRKLRAPKLCAAIRSWTVWWWMCVRWVGIWFVGAAVYWYILYSNIRYGTIICWCWFGLIDARATYQFRSSQSEFNLRWDE